MRHNNMISDHPKSTGILRADELSIGPPNLRYHKNNKIIKNKMKLISMGNNHFIKKKIIENDVDERFHIENYIKLSLLT